MVFQPLRHQICSFSAAFEGSTNPQQIFFFHILKCRCRTTVVNINFIYTNQSYMAYGVSSTLSEFSYCCLLLCHLAGTFIQSLSVHRPQPWVKCLSQGHSGDILLIISIRVWIYDLSVTSSALKCTMYTHRKPLTEVYQVCISFPH